MAEEPVTVLLSIVIPTLDAGAHLEACVTALEDGRKAALDQAMDVPDVALYLAIHSLGWAMVRYRRAFSVLYCRKMPVLSPAASL